MVQASQIIEFVDAIVAKFKPQRVILFGSYAYGEPTEDSDVDLLVVKNHRGANYEQIGRIRTTIQYDFALDLLVHSPRRVVARIAGGDIFLEEVVNRGLVLYAAGDSRMGSEGRRRLRRRLRSAAVA